MNPLQWTADLLAVLAATAVAAVLIALVEVSVTPIRVLAALPLVLFVTGYVFVAALYPGARPERADVGESGALTGLERLTLSVAVSVAVVPTLLFVLNFTPYGISLAPLVAAIAAWTLLFSVVAFVRRRSVDPAARFSVSPRVPYVAAYFTTTDGRVGEAAPFEARDGHQVLLNALLVVSAVVFVGVVAGALALGGPADDPFTEYYLVAEDDEGNTTIEALPDEMTAGESETLFVGIENQEGESLTYETVVVFERLDDDGEVTERTELDRFETSVDDGETELVEYQVTAPESGDDVRISFLLYRYTVQPDPSAENAHRAVWIEPTVN
ncbi:DUF1616 domain-containing protein [Natronorarus salvus]|uniref:DUF1616 domain-containing protein n=1 Tax=Natronorarus salvus TaxID=3117733 RepID=UPI002F262936